MILLLATCQSWNGRRSAGSGIRSCSGPRMILKRSSAWRRREEYRPLETSGGRPRTALVGYRRAS
jgi:hypothetical protein